ncbi:MAG: SulP family inorganic anion transporter, partial [Pirellulales bacterium]
ATIARQQRLTEQLATLHAELEGQQVSRALSISGDLHRAVDVAWEKSRAALKDLEGRVADAHASQAAVQRSLEDVVNTLKNHDWAAKIGLLTIAVLVVWRVLIPKKPTGGAETARAASAGPERTRFVGVLATTFRLVPAPLVAVALATSVATLLSLPVLYVEVPDNLWSEVHFPSMSVLRSVPWQVLLQAGIVLAVVASAETLLCATAVDKMRPELRTKYDRELAAQGVGNMLCGALGALPMTGVIVRSAANVDAGGQTRLAAILHGLWLLLFVSVLAFLLRMIPTASLAAMLVYTGYKLVNLQAIRELRKYGWGEVGVYGVTVVTIVVADLLTGVITGIALSAAKLLYTFSHINVRLDVAHAESKAVLSLEGAATFIRLPRLATELERVPDNVELHVDFEHLDYIDHACLDLLMSWAKQHEATGGSLVIDWDSLHASVHEETRNKQRSLRRTTV